MNIHQNLNYEQFNILTIGFPVTTAGEWPWNFEYSSSIHAIVYIQNQIEILSDANNSCIVTVQTSDKTYFISLSTD